MNSSARSLLLSFLAWGSFAISLRADVLYTGVNLAGADFGEGNLPGIYNQHYTYPTPQEVAKKKLREGL